MLAAIKSSITSSFSQALRAVAPADFDAAAEKILALGGQTAMPKFAIPGKCWQGYFTDADHNTFGLVQIDENAQ